jgi:hypothetical protein
MRVVLANFVMEKFNAVPNPGHFLFNEQYADEALEAVMAVAEKDVQ